MSSDPRLAFVLDALPGIGGGEKTLFAALEVFPDADIFTLIYNRKAFEKSPIAGRKIRTSVLNRLPLARSHHRLLLPLMPWAVERFDLGAYDVVLAFSYAVAHGVHVRPGARHLCYMYTPMRYAWHGLNIHGTHRAGHPLMEGFMERFRLWDRSAAARVHEFAAVSHAIAQRIESAYKRPARVIYPPVELDRFAATEPRGDYFVSLSRLVPHKRLDVVVDAFSRLRLPLKVIGEGPERRRLQERAGPGINFLGYQPEESVALLLAGARGLVSAAEEDFGIAIVEAQAAGCPVIAFRGGGALETVIEESTGILFGRQSAESLCEAIQRFASTAHGFRGEDMVANAQRFSKARFQQSLREFVGSSSSGAADIPVPM